VFWRFKVCWRECFGCVRSVRWSVLEVSGVLGECFRGFRSLRRSVLEVIEVLEGSDLAVLGVLGGVLWRF